MFSLFHNESTSSELPVITDNYKVLHFDEYPILFSGTNKFGNKIIGSLIDEDDDNNLLYYFSIIVNDKDFNSFYNKKKSYRNLIVDSKEIFIVVKTFNDEIVKTHLIPISSIPNHYLPRETSFIPDKHTIKPALSYSFSLKGKLTDFHKAIVNDINEINLKINDFLDESLRAIDGFGITAKVFSQPSSAGSYRLNFDIDFISQPQLKFFDVDILKVSNFLNLYLNYVTYKLPYDKDFFLLKDNILSSDFLKVEESFKEIYYSSNQEPASTVSELLIDSINNTAEKLSEVSEFMNSNDSFNSIEVGMINKEGLFLSDGYIDSDYKANVEEIFPSLDILTEEMEIISDESPNNYRILVYKINSMSGKGNALLYPNSSEESHKVRLTVNKNQKDLSNSVFTKSMYEDKVVDVSGIATKINGLYKKLECYL